MEWCLDREGESRSYVLMGMECLFCKMKRGEEHCCLEHENVDGFYATDLYTTRP